MEIVQQAFAGVSSISHCGVCGKPLKNPVSVAAGMGPICRGKGHGHAGEGKEKMDLSAWGEKFTYVPKYNRREAWCYVLVKGNTVIATEAPDNPGMSITNAAEDVATAVCYKYHIPLAGLVWFEHWHHDREEETFDRVEFSVWSGSLISPRWRPSTRAEAMGAIA